VLGVYLIGGLVLGAVDLAAQKILPYPWANLANSSAVWALGAFALSYWLRLPFRRAAAAGIVVLIVAVESYYLTATLVQHDSLTNLTQPSTQIWLLFAVLAGAVFAVAGTWAAIGGLLLRPLGVAIGGSVLIAEALVYLYRSFSASPHQSNDRQTALIETILGLLIVFTLARDKRRRMIAYGLCLPLSGLGFLAYLAAGFGQ
jgi:hypothetical protein